MEELIEKMAVILQWIYDDGEGGSYRPHIQEVLVAYDAAQQSVQATGWWLCKVCRHMNTHSGAVCSDCKSARA